jgi:putative transposase
VLNRFQLPTDVVFQILLLRGLVFSHEAIRDWEAKLAPMLTDGFR